MAAQSPETLIDLLEVGVYSHQRLEFEKLSVKFDAYERFKVASDPAFDAWSSYVRDFIGCWIDASNHEWRYHDPVGINDWIPIAERLIVAVRELRPFEPLVLRGKILESF